MPEHSKVFYVEDSLNLANLDKEFLESGGHEVVESASSLEEALAKIPGLNEKGVNVAVVDGNLTKRDVSGKDGMIIIEAIKNQHPDIKVIGHSADGPVVGADVNCMKTEDLSSFDKLVEAVTNI